MLHHFSCFGQHYTVFYVTCFGQHYTVLHVTCFGQHYTVLHVTYYPLSGSALYHNVNWRIRLSGRLLCNIEPSCSTNRQLTLHQNQIYTL